MEKEPRVEVPAFPTRQKAWAKTVQMENLTAIWIGPTRVSDYSKIHPRVADFFLTARYKQIPRLKTKNMNIDGFNTLQLVLIDSIIMFIPLKQAFQYNFFKTADGVLIHHIDGEKTQRTFYCFCSHPLSSPPQ